MKFSVGIVQFLFLPIITLLLLFLAEVSPRANYSDQVSRESICAQLQYVIASVHLSRTSKEVF